MKRVFDITITYDRRVLVLEDTLTVAKLLSYNLQSESFSLRKAILSLRKARLSLHEECLEMQELLLESAGTTTPLDNKN